MSVYIHIHIHIKQRIQGLRSGPAALPLGERRADPAVADPRQSYGYLFILRIVRPRIFESKSRSHCAKKLDGALRKSTSFV